MPAPLKTYAVILAHRSGTAPERYASAQRYGSMAEAQGEADRWTRHHGRPDQLDTDPNGFYAYVDWAGRPTCPARVQAAA